MSPSWHLSALKVLTRHVYKHPDSTSAPWQEEYYMCKRRSGALKLRNVSAARRKPRETGEDYPPLASDIAVTEEEEKRLVAYLAEYVSSGYIKQSVKSKVYYQRLAANEDGKTPWGTKHCSEAWRHHFLTNWERLYVLVLNRRRELKASQSGLSWGRFSPEEDKLFVDFLAEQKMKGGDLGGWKIYEELVKNKDEKWPWGPLRTQESWRTRYVRTARHELEPMVKARLAGLRVAPSSPSRLSEPTVAPELQQASYALPVEAHLSEGHVPEQSECLKSGSKPRSYTPTTFLARSSPALVEVEDRLAAVANEIPRRGLFSPQDDAVLLQYLIRYNGGLTVDTTQRGTTSNNPEVDMFHHFLDSVPDARRHTAQTWRKHYRGLKSHFDRLVEHFEGLVIRGKAKGEAVDEVQEECRPWKRRKLDGLGESVGEDGPELGASSSGFPEITLHFSETSDDCIVAGGLDPTDEDLLEELEVERSIYPEGDAHSGL
ncbi:hypothetical protein PQX77_011581 [Marasmius sp. AFHP31]|nr:hypothetical protein PQX77_011581 [Marasmius sp. AFHP31]